MHSLDLNLKYCIIVTFVRKENGAVKRAVSSPTRSLQEVLCAVYQKELSEGSCLSDYVAFLENRVLDFKVLVLQD